MSAELERTARRGEEVARLLACDAVREVIDESVASRREAILALKSEEAGRFSLIKAGLEALEELVAALESLAAQGDEARARMSGGGQRGRVL
ncbi:MAG: hypothetical protein ACOZEN_02295 [Thermodesulfobacteriota bacterium]